MRHTITTQNAASLARLSLVMAFDPKEVGKRIAAARHRLGWTQLKFALEANVSPSSVSRWERGELPPVRELMRIADVLELDVADLVEDQAETTRDAELRAELSAIRAQNERIEAMLKAVLDGK